ncbi:MAG: hypothetical protein Q4E62_00425 [Sutterellaceae bacterium]|nr:hypothetical protein [Sutterellaceae bacterium]
MRKKYSSRTIKNYGRLDLLLKADPHAREKMQAEAKAYEASKRKSKENALKANLDRPLPTTILSETSKYDDSRCACLGVCVLRKIWEKFGLDRQKIIQDSSENTAFDFKAAVFHAVAMRILMHKASAARWLKQSSFLYGACDLTEQDLTVATGIIGKQKAAMIPHLATVLDADVSRLQDACENEDAVGCLAFVLLIELSRTLTKKGIRLPLSDVVEALSSAVLIEIANPNGTSLYCKTGTEDTFQKVAAVFEIGKLPTLTDADTLRSILGSDAL